MSTRSSVIIYRDKTTVSSLIEQLQAIEDKASQIVSICDDKDYGLHLHFESAWSVGRVIRKGWSEEEECLYLIVDEDSVKWMLHDGSSVSKKSHRSPGPVYSSYEYHSTAQFIPEDARDEWISKHKPDFTTPDEYGFCIGVEVRRKIGHGDWSFSAPEWDDFGVVATIVESKGRNWKLSNGATIDKVEHYERSTNKRAWWELETEETKASFEVQRKAKCTEKCEKCGITFNPDLPGNFIYKEFDRYDHGTPWGVMSQGYCKCPECGHETPKGTPTDTGKNISGTIAYAVEGR